MARRLLLLVALAFLALVPVAYATVSQTPDITNTHYSSMLERVYPVVKGRAESSKAAPAGAKAGAQKAGAQKAAAAGAAAPARKKAAVPGVASKPAAATKPGKATVPGVVP